MIAKVIHTIKMSLPTFLALCLLILVTCCDVAIAEDDDHQTFYNNVEKQLIICGYETEKVKDCMQQIKNEEVTFKMDSKTLEYCTSLIQKLSKHMNDSECVDSLAITSSPTTTIHPLNEEKNESLLLKLRFSSPSSSSSFKPVIVLVIVLFIILLFFY